MSKKTFSSETIWGIMGSALFFFMLVTCCRCSTTSAATSQNQKETVLYGYTLPSAATYYGAMIFGSPDSLQAKAKVLNALGVNVVRESIVTQYWPGNSGRCDFWQKNDFVNILNISYMMQAQTNSIFCPKDSLYNFSLKVGGIFDRYKNAPVVVVENEEQNRNYRDWSHTSTLDYLNELSVVIMEAHKRGIKVANGGLTTDVLRTLTYRYLALNDKLRAEWFLQNCVPVEDQRAVKYKRRKSLERICRQADSLLNYYTNSEIDFVNCHVYFPLKYRGSNYVNSSDTSSAGLAEIIEFIKWRTNKPVITNETGTVSLNGQLVSNVLQAYDKQHLPYCIWWSGIGSNGAVPLHNPDGSLNINGAAFQLFIKSK